MPHIAIDFETFWSKKLKYSLKGMVAEQYCRHPLFEAYMISAADGTTTWAGHPRDFNWEALRGQTIVAHNYQFEKSVLIELHRRGLAPDVLSTIKAGHCTANLTSFLCNRRALDDAVEYLFGERLSKEARSDSVDKKWPTDFSPEQQKTMLEYARQDSFWCWKIFDKYVSQWGSMEQELSRITIDQGIHGVQINRDLLNDYIVQTHEMRLNTENQIPWIRDAEEDDWDDFNTKPTSTKCIAEQCRRIGIPCPPVKSDDEEAYADWEALYGPKHTWIYAVSAWRSVNKLYKTFLTVKERLRTDGTLPFALKYFGAHTGRWSGDAKVNMQNMRKRPIVCNEFGLLEMNDRRIDDALKARKMLGKWPEWVRHTIDFRHLIMPRPGKKMIVSDLSQIEPRVLAWLCGDTAMLGMMKQGMSPYEAHARSTMGWTGGPLKKAAETDAHAATLYALSKARILALGYGAGWEKFIVMAYDLAGLDITVNDPEWIEVEHPFTHEIKKVSGYGSTSKKTVEEYRAQNPKIAGENGIWQNLDGSFKRSVGDNFSMKLPSGRTMKYDRVRCEVRIEPDKETGKPRRKTVFTADIGGRRFQSYGGKLTENITQAIARDIFGWQVVNMDHNGWGQLFSVHDEAILEVDEAVTARDVEHEMSRTPEWMPGLPVAAEAKEVPYYQK